VLDEHQLKRNLERLKYVQQKSGCKIIMAIKAFSSFSVFPLIRKYLPGCTTSSLHEARLAREEFGQEVHIYSPGFKEEEFDEILTLADHIIFNSHSQLQRFLPKIKQKSSTIKVGLRLNPEHSEVSLSLYNPCSKYSRFGVTASELNMVDLDHIDTILIHTLCGQYVENLERVIQVVEEKFGHILHKIKCVNFGGGHLITRPDYNIDKLCTLLKQFKERYNVDVILEPGEAVVVNVGYLVASVLDIMHNEMDIAIIDTSATAHMPDVLEMPYRPNIAGTEKPGILPYTYKLGGNTCLSGDVIGDYSFDQPLQVGDKLVFTDMAQYTIVKNTTFNGVNLPSIAVWRLDNQFEIIKNFDYLDFRNRLS
jgi:carboxynorspermidine decarboxylase